MSRQEFLLDRDCISACSQVDSFLTSLHLELEGVLTTVGVNDSMSLLIASAARCWDWSRLVFERPVAADVQTFRHVAESLRPCLEHTLFPHGHDFARLEHRWPEADDLCAQYVVLCARVRSAFSASRRPSTSAVPAVVVEDARQWARPVVCEARADRQRAHRSGPGGGRPFDLVVDRRWASGAVRPLASARRCATCG